jgi:hypothetical protein
VPVRADGGALDRQRHEPHLSGWERFVKGAIRVGIGRPRSAPAATPCDLECPVAPWKPAALVGRHTMAPRPCSCWLRFLDTYRTMCVTPEPEFRQLLQEIRSFDLAA